MGKLKMAVKADQRIVHARRTGERHAAAGQRELPELDRLIPELEHLKAMDGMPKVWRARVETTENCADLKPRIHDLESRLKTLEKKLEK